MTPDVSALTTAFVQFGGDVVRKKTSQWDLQNDFFFHRNVTAPQVLPKLAAQGNPRPYRDTEDFTGNDPVFTDRTLTAYVGKWDFQMSYESLRNTYLSASKNGKLDPSSTPLHQYILEQYTNEFFSQLYDNTVGLGVYNSSGTTAAAICDGLRTLIAAAITATTLTPITTGAIASTDAVTKVETFVTGLPAWMRQKGFKIFCSYAIFDKYKAHYRTLNAFGFQRSENGRYQLDGIKGYMEPRGWMGTSSRLIAVPDVPVTDANYNLHMGTNDEAIMVYPTVNLNIIKMRYMYPLGIQIADLAGIFVNDQT